MPSPDLPATSLTSVAPPFAQGSGITDITALVLAGGRGARMGGVDKGLQPFRGQPLVRHALVRLAGQEGGPLHGVLVNANRNPDLYLQQAQACFDIGTARVVADRVQDFSGPLAGFEAGLALCSSPLLLTVPCDSPLFPLDLASRLLNALMTAEADIAVAQALESGRDGYSVLRSQPVFCLLKASLHESLSAFLASGGRKIDAWTAQHRVVQVPFNTAADDPRAFANANTLDELRSLEKITHMIPLEDIARSLQGYDPQALKMDDANAFIHRLVAPVEGVVTLPLRECQGRVLAEDLVSGMAVPAHDNSAMDGFAFDGAALKLGEPLILRSVGTALAGKAWQGSVGAGQCLKVMTGAILPAGLDTVVPHELVRVDGDTVHIPAGLLRAGDNRRLRGEDLQLGGVALSRGQRLSPAAIGLAASLGVQTLPVYRRLRVACMSTGDEVLSPGEAMREGAVYDSNRYTVTSLLDRLGCEVIECGVVRDDPVALEAAFRSAAAQADVIISSGGVSVGEADFTKGMMRKLGDVVFWRIAMRPGRPFAVGRIGNTVLFGLPGNPVAVMVTFLSLVRPALLRMMGAGDEPVPLLRAHSQEPMRKKPGRTEYQRGIVSTSPEGRLEVRTTGNQGSGVLSSMVQANGLIVLHHGQGSVAEGDLVDVMMFHGVV